MGSQGGAIQEPKSSTLARQGSLYNLTLDEVQNQLGNSGKPLGSMNLDELLKSVWSAEAGEASGLEFGGDANIQNAFGSSLNSQGSLTLSGDLSKKTVDEVWKDLQQKKSINRDRPNLGEMTLEDFLVKAGVVTEYFTTKDNDVVAISGVDSNRASQQKVSQNSHWMEYPHQNQQNNMLGDFVTVQRPFQVGANLVLDTTCSETLLTVSPSSLVGTFSDMQTLGSKRVASGNVVEKTVERRQKRMIKNRESAARSRARKQAYTQELEIKVSRLEEENERLRRLNEIERVLPSAPAPPPEPKHRLRRTNSAIF